VDVRETRQQRKGAGKEQGVSVGAALGLS